jgi:hypothetical protein
MPDPRCYVAWAPRGPPQSPSRPSGISRISGGAEVTSQPSVWRTVDSPSAKRGVSAGVDDHGFDAVAGQDGRQHSPFKAGSENSDIVLVQS